MEIVSIFLVEPGDTPDLDEKTDVFAELKSTGSQEQLNAGQRGYKNTLKFEMLASEYSEQSELEYKGNRLTIYRTYKPSLDKMELYAGERIGNNGRY
ncbi:MAG: phage head closure protein [Lachnospiraceae bacterium]|nr:phage head closure protein [Lachnospiraceae bacterium]